LIEAQEVVKMGLTTSGGRGVAGSNPVAPTNQKKSGSQKLPDFFVYAISHGWWSGYGL